MTEPSFIKVELIYVYIYISLSRKVKTIWQKNHLKQTKQIILNQYKKQIQNKQIEKIIVKPL